MLRRLTVVNVPPHANTKLNPHELEANWKYIGPGQPFTFWSFRYRRAPAPPTWLAQLLPEVLASCHAGPCATFLYEGLEMTTSIRYRTLMDRESLPALRQSIPCYRKSNSLHLSRGNGQNHIRKRRFSP